ncbi:unnamed protein product [Rotaria magnacalcarata]
MIQKNSTNNTYQRRIPRIIHQTWKDASIPPRWNLSVRSVRKLNADHFEYRLWTDNDMHEFVREKEPDVYANTFLTYSHNIQRVDAFRYILLYHLGGVYIDMDAGCSKSLDILLDALEALDPQAKHLAALPETKPNGLSNDFMISTKGHPLFAELVSHLSIFNHNYIVYYLTIMLSAGPLFLTINEQFFRRSSGIISVRTIEGKAYSPLLLWFAGGNSWHGRDAQIIKYIYEVPRTLQLASIITAFSLIFLIYFLYCCYRRRSVSKTKDLKIPD